MNKQIKALFTVIVCIALCLSGCGESSDTDSSAEPAAVSSLAGVSSESSVPGQESKPAPVQSEAVPEASAEDAVSEDGSWTEASNLTVNSLFTDNVILQRQQTVPVWGIGTDGKTVTVKFAGQVKTAAVSCGKWRVDLDPMKASSENRTMYISMDKELITVRNVLVGEVWLVSGQSNITVTFAALNITDQTKERTKGDRNLLRQFWVTQKRSKEAQSDVEGASWKPYEGRNIYEFSAVGYYFASKLQEKLNVPVGIVTAAVGGTYLEQWLDTVPLVKEGLCNPQPGAVGRDNYYNGMITPLFPYSVKGIVWYQGESNQFCEFKKPLYAKTFHKYLEVYRAGFENKNLPVCQVQLPIFDGKDHWEPLDGWAPFRYIQEGISRSEKNVFTAVTIDCGSANNIHPTDKEPVGERLMLLALRHVYGMNVEADSPFYKSHSVSGSVVTVALENVTSGIRVRGDTVTDAKVKGPDGNWTDAVCTVSADGKFLVFTSAEVSDIKGVSYCDSNAPTATLFEANGLPVAPFHVE